MMNLKKYIPGLLLLTAFIVLFGSCGMETKTVEPYLIKIDSLYAPDTVNIKSVFNIELYGYVGPNKCYAFEKAYHSVNDLHEITIEVWGRYTYYGDPCVEGEILMKETIEMAISAPGVYKIKGLQPNNLYTERKLVVK